jgi:hypothetical protein
MPSISVFDASLLWFDENPRDEAARGYGLHGWITLLTRNRASYDLAYELLSEIAGGSIKAKQISRLAGLPQSWKETLGSLPGDLDPRGTKVAIGDLVKFAIDRNQKPEFLAHLIPALPERDSTAPNRRSQPRRELAKKAIDAVYPGGVPDQVSEPNSRLTKKVGRWLADNKLPGMGDDTILRAAGRRK